MNLLWIIIAVIIGLIIFEYARHHLRNKFTNYIIIGVIVLIILTLISAYVDLSQLVDEDSLMVKTGNVVKTGIEKSTNNLQVKNTTSLSLEKLKESTNVFNSE
ncbi:MAG: hypothetical protein ABIJ18_04960 [archaeon]